MFVSFFAPLNFTDSLPYNVTKRSSPNTEGNTDHGIYLPWLHDDDEIQQLSALRSHRDLTNSAHNLKMWGEEFVKLRKKLQNLTILGAHISNHACALLCQISLRSAKRFAIYLREIMSMIPT